MGKALETHLVSRLDYLLVEIVSISIRTLERLASCHVVAESTCQRRLAIYDTRLCLCRCTVQDLSLTLNGLQRGAGDS